LELAITQGRYDASPVLHGIPADMPTPFAATASSTTPVETRNRFHILASQPPEETSVPITVANGAPLLPPRQAPSPIPLSAEESAVLGEIEAIDDPCAARLAAVMRTKLAVTSDPAARADIIGALAEACAARDTASNPFQSALVGFGLSAVRGGLNRELWRLFSAATPWGAGAAAFGGTGYSIYNRNWSSMLTVLPQVAAMMPSLRSQAEVEALIQALPATVRSSLETLHSWVGDADAALTPELDIRHAGPALAVAALLWYVQSRLPSPAASLQGVSGFVAKLPDYWQRLTGLNALGGAVLAPAADAPHAPDLTAPKQKLTREQKDHLVAHKHAFDRSIAPRRPRIAPPLQPAAEAAWGSPGQPARGGQIAPLPRAGGLQADDAKSSGWLSMPDMLTWLAGAGTTLANGFSGYQLTSQRDGGARGQQPDVEMGLLGETALPSPGQAAGVAAGLFNSALGVIGGARRPGTNRQVTDVLTSVAFTALGVAIDNALRPTETMLISSDDLIDVVIDQVLELPNGDWGTGLDVVAAPHEARSGRQRRDASVGVLDDAVASDAAVTSEEEKRQLGLSSEQLDRLGAASLQQRMRDIRLWAIAVADELAGKPGWEWVAQAPATERELLALKLHDLEDLQQQLTALDAIPDAEMDAALSKAGWRGAWQDIEVHLAPSAATFVPGEPVDDHLPLLAYCLTRAKQAWGGGVFKRNGVEVSAQEARLLNAFVGSPECARLDQAIDSRVEASRPVLEKLVQTKLIINAIKAKNVGAPGNGQAYLYAAKIVLDFVHGAADVQSSPLIYVDTLPDGTQVRIPLPNHLVLRSTSADEQLNGKVVVYRMDLDTLQTFDNENSFRAFMDTRSAKRDMAVNGHVFDRTLADDIARAASPDKREAVLDRVRNWESRYVRFQSGDRSLEAWNPSTSFDLAFESSTSSADAFARWAAGLVAHETTLAARQLENNRLHWSPLGIANTEAERAYSALLVSVLSTLRGHANPTVTKALKTYLKVHRIAVPDRLDPDRIQLQIGELTMCLTDWMTNGLQRSGLERPWLPVQVSEGFPDVPGGPRQRVEPEPWPRDDELAAMHIEAYHADGSIDHAMTDAVQDGEALRAIFAVMEEFSQTNSLAEDYKKYLVAQEKTEGGQQLSAALGRLIQVRTAWMIEVAWNSGVIDHGTYQALKRTHAGLSPQDGTRSTLKAVTLAGVEIRGVWAMKAGGVRYIFLTDTLNGDQLLTLEQFRTWLSRSEGEDYVLPRTPLVDHPIVALAFTKVRSSTGIAIGFSPTQGPDDAARKMIEGRIADVDERTVSQLERIGETLQFVGTIMAGLLCSIGTGGVGAALCIATTLAVVAKGIHETTDLLRKGKDDEAIWSILENWLDALDILEVKGLSSLLFQLGRKAFTTLPDAAGGLAQLLKQRRAFTADGIVNKAFVRPRGEFADLPMLGSRQQSGAQLYQQDNRHYIKQENSFVEVYTDADGTLRLRDPDDSAAVGAPVEFHNGRWQRNDEPPTVRGATTPHNRPGSPDWATNDLEKAELLPPARQSELEAMFGHLTLTQPNAHVQEVVRKYLMELRIAEIVEKPGSLGLPGDEVMIMRAWADSEKLGNGKGVVTYTIVGREWTQLARFGNGNPGLHVKVKNPRDLPTLEKMIASADHGALLSRLGLPPEADDATLAKAVRAELARTIGANPTQSLQSWQRWLTLQHHLPTAADNLVKHYRDLTKAEAEELVNSATVQQKYQLESWDFPPEIQTAVSNVLANRAQSQQREAIIQGNVHTLAQVNELGIHLKAVLPGRDVRAVSVEGDRVELLLTASTPDVPEVKLVFAGSAGELPTDATGKVYATWQEGIFEQLTPAERTSMPGRSGGLAEPIDLRRAVLDDMKNSPIVAVCSLPRAPGGRAKRADDCGPVPADPFLPSISISPQERAVRDAVTQLMDTTHASLKRKDLYYSAEKVEFDALNKQAADLRKLKADQRKGIRMDETVEEMDDTAAARLKELEKRSFGDLDSFDIGNVAGYTVSDITYDGQRLELPSTFPLKSTALSGNGRPLLGTDGVLPGAPTRYVLVPDTEAFNVPQVSAQYHEYYAGGSDLGPVTGRYFEEGQASKLIILKEADLVVTVPGPKGTKRVKTPIHLLTDDQILLLSNADYSSELRKLFGDSGLLPANVRTWKAGVPYRMYQIRSCSEGKILDAFYRAVGQAVPALNAVLWRPTGVTIDGLGGTLNIVSEMNPCTRSCDRRLNEMIARMPGMQVKVFYRFENNPERTAWWRARKVDVIFNKNRESWEKAGKTEAEMRKLADTEWTTLFADAKGKKTWVDEFLVKHPPKQPVPKLWEPQLPV